jgi:hypothetical protein
MSLKPLAAWACVLLLLSPIAARSQEDKEKVYRSVSAALAEDILRDLDIRYKKNTAKDAAIVSYDFERKTYKIRLMNFGGKDLMLDALFPATSIERMNQWNVQAKFSRGVLYPGGGKPYSAIETNLDCVGGVTAGAIKQFIRRFDDEVKSFDKFLAGGGGAAVVPPPAASQDAAVFPNASGELVDGVLKGLNITANKAAMKNGGFTYDYERNNYRIRLVNFGGKDVMLTAQFRKATLEEINNYNLKRKFIRAVLYQEGGREYTALEVSLDCEGGVTENILRAFIAAYDGEVREFDKYLNR